MVLSWMRAWSPPQRGQIGRWLSGPLSQMGFASKAIDKAQHCVSTETPMLVLVEKDQVAAGTNIDVHLLAIGVSDFERFHMGEAVGAGKVFGRVHSQA